MGRPDRLYSNQQAGESLYKIARRKIAIADNMPFDDVTKNAIANRRMSFADGSAVSVRRDLGGVDRIIVQKPSAAAGEAKEREYQEEEHGYYFFALQLYNTPDCAFAASPDNYYPIGYVIAEITEDHELEYREIVIYPERDRDTGEISAHRLYTTIYANQANIGWYYGNASSRDDFILDYKHLLGPNNEQLFVSRGNYRYWELNNDGYWYFDFGVRMIRDVEQPHTSTFVDPFAAEWGQTEEFFLKIVEDSPPYAPTDRTENELGDPLYTYKSDNLFQTFEGMCVGYPKDYISRSSSSGHIPEALSPEDYFCSKDGNTFSLFYYVDYWSSGRSSSGTKNMTLITYTETHGFGGECIMPMVGCNFPPLDWAESDACVDEKAQKRHDDQVDLATAEYGTAWDGRCGDRWFLGSSGLGEMSHTHYIQIYDPFNGCWGPASSGLGHATFTWGSTFNLGYAEETNVDPTEYSATLHIYSFGVQEEVPVSWPRFVIDEVITHKYYEPDDDPLRGRFAGCGILRETNESGAYYNDYPQKFFITYSVNKNDGFGGNDPTIRWHITGVCSTNSHGAPYLTVTDGDNNTYYTDGNCFWGEKIVVD